MLSRTRVLTRKFRQFKWVPASLLILLFIPTVFGNSSNWRFRHVGSEEGLSQVTVQAIQQDHQGFLWIGTQDGLNRYDGYSFRVFKPKTGSATAISDNYITRLLLDQQNQLWVGTRGGGLNLFDREKDQFKAFIPKDEADKPHPFVDAIYQCENGLLLIGTRRGGLFKFDPQVLSYSPLKIVKTAEFTRVTNILNIREDRDGYVWITTNRGLWRLAQNPDGDWVPRQFLKPEIEPKGLEIGPKGKIWATTNQGIMTLTPFEARFKQRTFRDVVPPITAQILFRDADDYIWAGTETEGAYRFDADPTQPALHFTQDQADPFSIGDNRILCINQDHTGSIWFGSYNAAISILSPDAQFFRNYTHNPSNPKSLSDNAVLAITEDDRGNLWVGTQRGLNRSDDYQSFERYVADPENPNTISNQTIRAVLSYGDYLWVGTQGDGISLMSYAYPGVFRQIRHEPEKRNSLPHNYIRLIRKDTLNRIWVGTQGGGMVYLDPEDALTGRPNFKKLAGAKIFNDGTVRSFHQENDSTYWIGTQGRGLIRLKNPKDPKILQLLPKPLKPADGPAHDVIISMCEGIGDTLWVGTPRGISQLDKKTLQFQHFSEGMANTVSYAMLKDKRNYIWVSTNAGLSRFDPWSTSFKNFNVHDGLPDNEFNASAFHAAENGRLYFGSIGGLASFVPEQLKKNRILPKLAITELLLFNEPVFPGEPIETHHEERLNPLKAAINQTKHIELRHDDIFTLKFVGMHYASPPKNLYAFKLIGLHDDWVYTDAENRAATFTNLSPKEYTFLLKASNKDGTWTEEDLALKIQIKPPFYRTPLAYFIYITSIVGLALLIARHQKNQLAQERAVIEKLTQVDRLKDEFLANTSHELRTPLNGMIGLAESMLEGATGKLSDEVQENLSMIAGSGHRLATLVNDILDFSKLKHQSIEIYTHSVDLHALIDIVLSIYSPLTRNRPVTLQNRVSAALPPVLADENRLQQILHNLLGNALKFTEAGSIAVDAQVHRDMIHVAIVDTGIGIPEDKQEEIFNSFAQVEGHTGRVYSGTGLGLAITRQLVELHRGELWVNSSPGKGSTFTFSLPISTEKEEASSEPTPINRSAPEVAMPIPEPTGLDVESVAPIPEEELTETAQSGEGWHVLIVDDEPVNRMVLRNHLSHRQYRLTEASTGPEAIALFEADPSIDVILLDIMMPRMSGYEVCRHLRKQHPSEELPIIFLSARNQVKDISAGFREGGNDYLTKPFSREELIARLNHHQQLLHAHRLVKKQSRKIEKQHEQLLSVQQQLLVNEKMVSLGCLTAGVAHEINNPASYAHGSIQNLGIELQNFKSYLFEIAGDDADPDILQSFTDKFSPLEEQIKLAREGTDRIKNIVMDLNFFARGERGKVEKVILTDNIRTTLNLVKANFKEWVAFDIRFEDPLEIHCKPAEMNQVFMNFIVNACQAIQSKIRKDPNVEGLLEIRTEVKNNLAHIHFTDNGCGIPEENLGEIFRPFFTTKSKNEGTGQGLAITADIVKRHKGEIQVASRVGKGTSFTVILPFGLSDADMKQGPNL